MNRHALFRFSLLLATAAVAPTFAAPAAEFAGAAQPQLAATADGRVWVAFGRGKDICVATSTDGGASFGEPVRVTSLPSAMIGRRRGPRIVAHGEFVTVTVMAGEFFAFNSKDGGKTWTGPALINDVRGCAREGLNGLSVGPDGRLFAVWLDHRGERTQLYSAESADHGVTWSGNKLVYRAPAGDTVCECCHPSALFNARGDLAVMWRNAIGGNRDMWFAVRPAGAAEFGAAAKLGEGSWQLKACPMDGGFIFADGEGFATVWQRNGSVFSASPGQPERKLAAGMQPIAVAAGARRLAIWQQGADLWSSSLDASATPASFATNARFPAAVVIPNSERIVVAYERGNNSVVAPLEASR